MEDSRNTDFLKQYQDWVETTVKPNVANSGLYYPLLAMNAEAGEAANRLCKKIRSGEPINEDDRLYLSLELGDILWNISRASTVLGFSLKEILNINMEKINGRQKEGK